MEDNHKWSYNGPVCQFGRCIQDRWSTETIAPTEAKARSNMTYQFKRQARLEPHASVTLIGKIVKEY